MPTRHTRRKNFPTRIKQRRETALRNLENQLANEVILSKKIITIEGTEKFLKKYKEETGIIPRYLYVVKDLKAKDEEIYALETAYNVNINSAYTEDEINSSKERINKEISILKERIAATEAAVEH